jgi:hypothetical protein
MFTTNVDPELKASIAKQVSDVNEEMGISAMYEIFRWSAQSIPDSLNSYSNKLKNINYAIGTRCQFLSSLLLPMDLSLC